MLMWQKEVFLVRSFSSGPTPPSLSYRWLPLAKETNDTATSEERRSAPRWSRGATRLRLKEGARRGTRRWLHQSRRGGARRCRQRSFQGGRRPCERRRSGWGWTYASLQRCRDTWEPGPKPSRGPVRSPGWCSAWDARKVRNCNASPDATTPPASSSWTWAHRILVWRKCPRRRLWWLGPPAGWVWPIFSLLEHYIFFFHFISFKAKLIFVYLITSIIVICPNLYQKSVVGWGSSLESIMASLKS